MRVIRPTREEKKKLWDVPYIFQEKMVTAQWLKDYSNMWGINTRYLEVMFWQLDTLYLLSKGDLTWKGGTCVQSHMDPLYQRYSVDLDFNSSLDREGIIQFFESLNAMIKKDGKFVELNGVKVGLFSLHSENERIGVLNFIRLVPSKHKSEYPVRGEVKILGVLPIKIQVNYRYFLATGFTSLKTELMKPGLAPAKIIGIDYKVWHSSLSDLLADKLLAMIHVVGRHQGRMRIKDAYDIILILRKGEGNIDFSLVKRKIDVVSETWKIDYDTAVNESLKTLGTLKSYDLEVRGLRGSVGHNGYTDIILQWRKRIDDAVKVLREEL